MDYAEALTYISSFTDMERGGQASGNPPMSLDSMRSLLGRLNDPHLARPTIHITGSKGKGSTAAMIEGILRQAGLQTALYSSPHLHAYTERIQIGGDAVTPEEFAAGLEAIRTAVEAEQASAHGSVSTFGILTALFFWLVRAQMKRVDWQIVEVGLGGSFDATNVFASPEIAVITPISLEHTAILGSTPAEIAFDKAGIIKPGSTCILAPQQDSEVYEVIRARCDDVGAELVDVAALYEAQVLERYVYGQSFQLNGPSGTRELRTPMLGRHQVDNAATAVAAIDALRRRGVAIPDSAIPEGLARTRVRGRMEVMGQRPLIIADGAHNGESAGALAATLRDYFEWKRCFLVIGATRDKDIRAMGFKLARLAELIVCTGFANPRAADPYTLIQELGFLGPPAVAEDTVADAMDTALTHANPEDLICVTGSLYVVAEARQFVLGEATVA